MRWPSSTIAAADSSQEVSIPRTRIDRGLRCKQYRGSASTLGVFALGAAAGGRRADQPLLRRERRRLLAVTQIQFLKNVAQMHLHRVHGDLQVVGDLLIAPAGCNVLEDLALARGELVEAGAGGARRGAGAGELFEQAGGERRRDRGAAVGQDSDRVVQRV